MKILCKMREAKYSSYGKNSLGKQRLSILMLYMYVYLCVDLVHCWSAASSEHEF